MKCKRKFVGHTPDRAGGEVCNLVLGGNGRPSPGRCHVFPRQTDKQATAVFKACH